MNSSLYEILPWFAALGFIVVGATQALGRPPVRGSWVVPAGFAALLLAWSLFTIMREGFAAVWVEHTRNAWGNQIWFDLLMAAGLAFVLLLRRTRAVGMRSLPWLALVAVSGSVGLYAMLARCMFLEQEASRANP